MSSRVRIWVATAGAGGALASATWLLARETHRQWRLVAGPAPASLDEAVTVLATALALVLCLWLATSTVVALLAHLPGRLGDRASRVAQVLVPGAHPAGRRRAGGSGGRRRARTRQRPRRWFGRGGHRRAAQGDLGQLGDGWGAARTRFVVTPAASVAASPSGATLGAGPGFAPTTHTSPPTPGRPPVRVGPPPDPWSAPR